MIHFHGMSALLLAAFASTPASAHAKVADEIVVQRRQLYTEFGIETAR